MDPRVSLLPMFSASRAFHQRWEDHVEFNDPQDGEEIALLAGTSFHPKTNVSICRHKDGRRMSGVIYQNYTGESIGMHSAVFEQHGINRDMLFVAFDYPFNQLGVKRIFGQVPETNEQAFRINSKLGFKQIARIEGVFPHNVACLVMRLERDDCRMLKVKPRNLKSNLS